MTYTVHLTREAWEDLQRLEDFLVDMALEHGDLDLPGRAVDAIRNEMRVLQTNPYTCRKVSSNPRERELIIPFGGSGYVARSRSSAITKSWYRRFATSARMTITEGHGSQPTSPREHGTNAAKTPLKRR